MFYRDTKTTINGIEVRIGNRIDYFRNLRNMTQEDLAKKLGVTQATVCAWETGRCKPRPKMIDKILKVLRVDAETFVGSKPINYLTF